MTPSPWEEVRDFFHYCDNYIDAVDRAAERLRRRRAASDGDGATRVLADRGVAGRDRRRRDAARPTTRRPGC